VEYFNYLAKITKDARCTYEIKSRTSKAEVAFRKKILFSSKLDLNLRKKLVQRYPCSIALYGAKTSTLQKVDHKYLESSEMCYLKRMKKIRWTNHVINGVLHRVKDDRNIAHIIKRRQASLTGHILHINCPLKHVINGKIKKRDRCDRKMRNKM